MNQAKSDVKVEELAREGISKKWLGGEDIKDKTKPLEFQPRIGQLFDVEVASDGNDFIFHFYPPQTETFWQRMKQRTATKEFADHYWEELFPTALDAAARAYFKAEFPRLEAMHMVQADCTTEFAGRMRPLDSWWMRAKGFTNSTLDPDAFVEKFYLALEASLDSRNLM